MTSFVQEAIKDVLADPLASAREAEHAVGFIGSDFPPDIALASSRVFCHLPWRAGRLTPTADQWLESAFPGWSRSILEDWAAGGFDCFAQVVFSRSDDATQRLYYYVCELQRQGRIGGPRPLMLDVATIPRDSSIRHTRRALAMLLDELEVDAAHLAAGIEAANLRRRWYHNLAAQDLPGSLRESLARATLFRDLYPELASATAQANTAQRGVLLVGSTPPDERLHRAAEGVGWNVRGELHPYALGRHGLPIETGAADDPLHALALHLNRQTHGARTFADRAALLTEALDASAAQAVVFWMTEEDESMVWDLPRLRAVLAQRELPALALLRRRWDLADDSITELEQFLEGLSA